MTVNQEEFWQTNMDHTKEKIMFYLINSFLNFSKLNCLLFTDVTVYGCNCLLMELFIDGTVY